MTQTPTERYLERLCRSSFLRMWSHPHPYRAQKDCKTANQGKELCDLLAVFGEDVLIFSDKHIAYPSGTDPQLNWKRWYQRAISKSVDQIRGAQKWLRTHPGLIFADKGCTQQLPVALPPPAVMRVHRVLVAHGAADACRRAHNGGSGSLIVNTIIKGDAVPFHVGVVDPEVGFVHVLDEVTLDLVLGELDTMPEFRDYLAFKEGLIASGKHILATGEEDLLGLYLSSDGGPGTRGRGFGDITDANVILAPEGIWDGFKHSPERAARDAANRDSYSLDRLIDRFAQHSIDGTQYSTTGGGPQRTEQGLRYLAAEPRTTRRVLVRACIELYSSLGSRPYSVGMCLPQGSSGTCYVLLVYRQHDDESYEDYRTLRREFLRMSTAIARIENPSAAAHVGIAMSPLDSNGHSEDLVLIDQASWTPELESEARKFQQETGFLSRLIKHESVEREYPVPTSRKEPAARKPGRNDPCPCGSGLKWKKCCGAR